MKILMITAASATAATLQELLTADDTFEVCSQLDRVLVYAEGWRPDVVLLDLELPVVGGLEACAWLHAVVPEIPFVALGRRDDPQEALRAVQEGAQDHLLIGPTDRRLLQRCLRYAVERKQAQRDKLQLEERLSQVQRLESVGQLAGGMAHDFNNILTLIVGHCELALEDKKLQQSARARFEEIEHAASRATSLIRQLLIFSREHISDPQPIDLNESITGMVRMLNRLIGEDIELSLELASNQGHVVADPVQIEQVLMNLVINARDAMPKGGCLLLATRHQRLKEPRQMHSGELAAGEYLVLRVRDNGTGMDAQTRARLFEPFFTTKEPGRGTGLGLATVHGVVRQCGGGIEVRSQLGLGTTFDVYLPWHPAAYEAPKVQSRLVDVPRGSETILLVEDEAPLLQMTKTVLEGQGYRVVSARSAEDAIGQFVAQPEEIDLLLTDVVMPGMSGGELAARLEGIDLGLKILYMSGYSVERLDRQGGHPDAPLLEKPFTPHSLAEKVRQVLDT